MLRTTHILFALFIYLLLLYYSIINFNLLGLIIIIISTLLPDIDSSKSTLGKRTKAIAFSFKHRGFFHSLLFGVLIILIFYYSESILYLEFMIGYFSHLILDSFNYQGIYFFWPFKIKHKGFIKTNSLSERLIKIFLLAVDIYLVIIILL